MYARRVHSLFVLLGLPFLVVASRLYHLQIVRGVSPDDRRANVSIDEKFLAPERGRILDRRGRVLAVDEVGYDLCVNYWYINPGGEKLKEAIRSRVPRADRKKPEIVEKAKADVLAEIEGWWDRLAEQAGRPRAELDKARELVRRRIERRKEVLGRGKGADFELAEERADHPILTALPRETAMAMETAEPRLAGVSMKFARGRHYPFEDRAAQIIGTLGAANAKDVQNKLSRENLAGIAAGDVVGRGGIEQAADVRLRGEHGYTARERGKKVDDFREFIHARPGEDVVLSLDMDLQAALEDRLTGRRGAIVVLDVPTGEVLAMVTWPRYDLNTFREDYTGLLEDPDRPLANRALSPYAPGSTFKPIAGIAAIESGRVREDTCLQCTGKWPEGGNFACWIARSASGGSHGPINLAGSLRVSCNHYYFHAAQMMGGEYLADWAKRFGLGKPTGVGIPGESAGLIPDEDWLARRPGRNGAGWQKPDERLVSIGQGATLATPVQMANAMAIIARNGVSIRPHLIIEEQPEPLSLGISAEALRAVHRGLRAVVEPGGLAYNTVHIPGLPISGKTGTAQVWGIVDGRRQQIAPHCWFVGFAPADAPRIAFAVMLENVPDGGGGASAGPYAKTVVELSRRLGYIDGPTRRGTAHAASGGR